jgi:hypothetical protein
LSNSDESIDIPGSDLANAIMSSSPFRVLLRFTSVDIDFVSNPASLALAQAIVIL